MSTNRESATDFMDARYFADVVYDKWIFDVPKIFDICTLYGSYNAKVWPAICAYNRHHMPHHFPFLVHRR
jgi:hypothetical protein